jgi:hypothetical protein
MRGLRAAIRGVPLEAASLITTLWPSPLRRVEPATFSKIVKIALPLAQVAPDALIALHAEARPDDQGLIERELFRIHEIKPLLVKRLSRAWADARREEAEGGGAELLTRVLDALPKDQRTARLQEEVSTARVDSMPNATEHIVAKLSLESEIGPPVLQLQSKVDVAIGPNRFERFNLRWRNELGATQTAGTLKLPRAILTPLAWRSFPVLIDAPREPGTWRMELLLGETEIQIPWEEPPATVLRSEPREYGPRDLVELSSSWPIRMRLTGDSATAEVFEDGHGGFWVLPISPTGRVLSVDMDARPWMSDQATLVPTFSIRETGESALGKPLPNGERSRIQVTLPLPKTGKATLEVRWPLNACLVEIYALRLKEES